MHQSRPRPENVVQQVAQSRLEGLEVWGVGLRKVQERLDRSSKIRLGSLGLRVLGFRVYLEAHTLPLF